MTHGVGPFLPPGAWLAGFMKRTTIHCYIQNMKALGLVVSEKFLCFSHDAPGAWPVGTPGARLAGFIKGTTRHCYTQNMKALGLVVSEKKIYLAFPIVSLWELSVQVLPWKPEFLSDLAQNLMQPFPHPNDGCDKI